MAYEIIALGNGEILKSIFDAIAICLNSQTGTLYIPLIRIGMIIGSLWTALYAIYGDYIRAINGWLIPMTIIINLLFVPQVTVWIKDPITNYSQKVDHVPYGLAMIAGNVSKIGYMITKQIESVFVLPDDLKYQKTGTLFASQLLQQAKTFRITNENLAENMRQFVGQCVTYDLLMGRKYTIEDLRHSDDLWGLVSMHASPVRAFLWRDLKQDLNNKPRIITCQEGVTNFDKEWKNELTKTATIFSKKIFGKDALINPEIELLKYLPIAYQELLKIAKSGEDLLKQQMMIYAIVDGIEQKSTSLGNAPNFALRRAYLEQRSNYQILGALGSRMLPTIKGLIEAISYASFMFIVPLAVLPFGYVFIKNWLQTLVWLQAWAPLYAILNYIMTIGAKSKSIALLSLSNNAGVTIASSVGLSDLNADLSAMASYLGLSIPFLSLAVVKGLSMVNVGSILTGVSQSAASHATHDALTGNYSFGNITTGTQQIANTSMLNHSYAASLRTGSFHQGDGRYDLITSSDGSQILNVGSSNLPIGLNIAETKSSQLSKQASKSYQKALQQSESYSKSMANTLRQTIDLSEHLSNSNQSVDSFSDHQTIEQTTSLNKSVQIIKDFAKDHNISIEQGTNILAMAGIENNKGALGVIGSITGNINSSAQNQEIYHHAKKIAQSEDFQNLLRQSSQLAHNKNFTEHNEQNKKLSDSINKSWDEANNFKEEHHKSFTEAKSYQQQASLVKNASASINANYTQEFVEWFAEQKSDHTNGRLGKKAVAHIIAHNPEIALQYAKDFMATKNISLNEDLILDKYSPDNLRTSYNQEKDQKFIKVNKENTLNEMNIIKQKFIDNDFVKPDVSIKNDFTKDATTIQNQLTKAEQDLINQYNTKELQHLNKSQKNLTGQAIKNVAIQGAKLVIDPIVTSYDFLFGEKKPDEK